MLGGSSGPHGPWTSCSQSPGPAQPPPQPATLSVVRAQLMMVAEVELSCLPALPPLVQAELAFGNQQGLLQGTWVFLRKHFLTQQSLVGGYTVGSGSREDL